MLKNRDGGELIYAGPTRKQSCWPNLDQIGNRMHGSTNYGSNYHRRGPGAVGVKALTAYANLVPGAACNSLTTSKKDSPAPPDVTPKSQSRRRVSLSPQ